MFIKVFKYDFLSVLDRVKFFFISLIGIVIITKLFSLLPSNGFLNFINVILQFAQVIGFMALFIVPFFLCMQRYWKTMLADEGYLTHTLPVKKSTLLLSKYLNVFVFYLIAILIGIVCLTIIDYQFITVFSNVLARLFNSVVQSGEVASIFVAILVLILSCALCTMIVIAMCLSLGARHDQKRGLMTFIYLVIAYFVIQFLVTCVCFNLIENVSITNMISLLWIMASCYIVVSIAAYFMNLTMIKKYLNLQ